MTLNPFVEVGLRMQTTRPITITGRRITRDTGDPDPLKLEDLSQERLIEVTRRVLTQPDYAARVRAFLRL